MKSDMAFQGKRINAESHRQQWFAGANESAVPNHPKRAQPLWVVTASVGIKLTHGGKDGRH